MDSEIQWVALTIREVFVVVVQRMIHDGCGLTRETEICGLDLRKAGEVIRSVVKSWQILDTRKGKWGCCLYIGAVK